MLITSKSLCEALKSKGYLVFEQDDKMFNLNLIGIRSSDMTPNTFNDYFCIMWKYGGHWSLFTTQITTDPGMYWLTNPMNVKGTAILKPGQYRGMWKLGKHQGRYEALKQVKPCTVIRDADKDRELDLTGVEDTGLFGINHHKAGKSSTQVDKWSAGCQVQPVEFIFDFEMSIFRQASKLWGNSFTYTLIEEKDL